jgi:hypothetical protein
MQSFKRFGNRFAWGVLISSWFWAGQLMAATSADLAPGSGYMAADSPMSNYTAKALGWGLGVGALVALLLAGAFLVVNVGLISKREEDRTGTRDPSDVAVRNLAFPGEHAPRRVFPALDSERDEEDALLEAGDRKVRIRGGETPLPEDQLRSVNNTGHPVEEPSAHERLLGHHVSETRPETRTDQAA